MCSPAGSVEAVASARATWARALVAVDAHQLAPVDERATVDLCVLTSWQAKHFENRASL